MSGFLPGKKKLPFIIFFTTVVVLLAIWLWSASPDTVFRMIRYNTSGIDDYKIFPNRQLLASQTPFHFDESSDDSRVPQIITFGEDYEISLDELLKSNDTLAFLIIKEDTILFEKYYEGYTQSSLSFSFSMAKSVLSILIGCAIDDGYIQSVDQPVTDFVPELAKNGYERVTIKHLLQMTSGMDYTENDNPFDIHPRFYYTSNLEKELVKLRLREEPGQQFIYKSGENALLGLILQRALGTKTITEYMQERLWEPLGMEFDGMWSIDHEGDGLEKTWCCVSAAARDFAKLGRLYLNYGNWDGEQILSRNWIEQSTKIDTTEGSAWNYQYQWWLVSRESSAYMAIGHLEQYLYINPEKQLIIVRLGKSGGNLVREEWIDILTFLTKQVR
ncbi:MAG: serine hydrolase [Chloroflexi bacterium HGW-Chloroflexi-10]|nr:MAG: serine hydrolase [Chloroflexi bacterium HGW-Chloroflexi-10]